MRRTPEFGANELEFRVNEINSNVSAGRLSPSKAVKLLERLFQHGHTEEYKIANVLDVFSPRIHISTYSGDLVDHIENSLESGEVVHMIIIDNFSINEDLIDGIKTLFGDYPSQRYKQDLSLVPIFVVFKSVITPSIEQRYKLFKSSLGNANVTPLVYDFADRSNYFDGLSITEYIARILSDYREKLLLALDFHGFCINWKTGKISISPAFKQKAVNSYRFLSLEQNLSKFIVINKSVLNIEESIIEFESILNQVCTAHFSKHRRSDAENVLHRFLIGNPHFVYQNYFTRFYTEPMVYFDLANNKYGKPDFILKSTITNEVHVMDLKLPTENVLIRDGAALSRKIVRGIDQIVGYRSGIENSAFPVLGDIDKVDGLSLVVGRDVFMPPMELAKHYKNNAVNGVHLIGYDNLIEIQKRVVDGMLMLT